MRSLPWPENARCAVARLALDLAIIVTAAGTTCECLVKETVKVGEEGVVVEKVDERHLMR